MNHTFLVKRRRWAVDLLRMTAKRKCLRKGNPAVILIAMLLLRLLKCV